jgi:hypothetical protein
MKLFLLYDCYSIRIPGTRIGYRTQDAFGIPGGSDSVPAQQRAAEAGRDAAISFRGESVPIVGHKHINALLIFALLKEPLARFGSHIVEDALPYLLATDVIERLCSEGEWARASN